MIPPLGVPTQLEEVLGSIPGQALFALTDVTVSDSPQLAQPQISFYLL